MRSRELLADPSPPAEAWAALLNASGDRFLCSGSYMVASRTQADYLKAYVAYQRLWERLDADTAAEAVKAKNYQRLFDAAREKVRAWKRRR